LRRTWNNNNNKLLIWREFKEGKVINNKIRQYRVISGMNEERIPKKVLHMKIKHPKGTSRPRQVRKDVTH
jgi:hypothetical protein